MIQHDEKRRREEESVRVLLADDNPAMLEEAARILTPEFHVVGTVGNGEDLLQAVRELQPHVLILDISMPRLNGLDAARLLNKSGSSVRIVFLTVHEDQEFVEESLTVGALGYVVKPRLTPDLPIAIKEALLGRTFISPTLSSALRRD